MLFAARHRPSLIIDCANAANPHALFPEVPMEALHDIYVVELELLYKFRDVLKKAPDIVGSIGAKCVAITTFEGLFHYRDEEENYNIHEHAWELMRELSQHAPVLVGITPKQKHFALRYCDKIIGDIARKPVMPIR